MSEHDDHDLDHIADLLREGPVELETPGASLWAAITAELGDDLIVHHDPVTALDDSHTSEPARVGGGMAVAPPATVLRPRRGWGRPTALLTLAAAVVLLLAVPVYLAVRPAGDEILATAELAVLTDEPLEVASAEVVETDGRRFLRIETTASAPDGEFLELWLLEADDTGVADLVSLGRLDGSGDYEIPEGVDLDRLDVVDVSVEPDDGNPDHSGASILRGPLV